LVRGFASYPRVHQHLCECCAGIYTEQVERIGELMLAAQEMVAHFRDDMPKGEGTSVPHAHVVALRKALASMNFKPEDGLPWTPLG